MKRDCCTGISPCAAVPFLVLAGHGAQWRDLNWLFCISCTIIKNCEVYTRYHWERRITPLNKMLTHLNGYKREAVLAPLFKMLEATFDLFVPAGHGRHRQRGHCST